MSPKRKLEYFLLRYAPDAVKEEFINIGLVINELGSSGQGFADVRFTKDWSRVLCMDAQADIAGLEFLTREITAQFAQLKDRPTLLRWLSDSASNLIQLSEPKGLLSENPEAEMQMMTSLYLERAKAAAARVLSGRQQILAAMRDAWEQANVAGFLSPFPVKDYTKPGDRFQFDFSYTIGGTQGKGRETKLFHAVSLKSSVDAAVTLAARYPKIASAISARGDTALDLTAVIDDDLDRSKEEVHFALAMLEEEKIQVAAVTEMPAIAEVARRDLGV